MRSEVVFKGKGLAGTSDLTLLTPVKPGFVPSLDAVTYVSRLKRLLKVLHLGRASAHEYALARPISDAVERIGRIHDVRVVLIEPQNLLLLSASFDGSWESYFRALWQKTGRLLDAIYCNTVDYVSAWDHSYEQWREWARRVQLETDFFYGLPGTTVDDRRLLRDAERHRRRTPDKAQAELDTMRCPLRSVEKVATDVVDIPRRAEDAFDSRPAEIGKSERELVKQGLQALAGLYSLTDWYLPGTPEGIYLERAAVEFLVELGGRKGDLQDSRVQRRFKRQVRWLAKAGDEAPPPARMQRPQPTAKPAYDTRDVQAGVVEALPDGDALTHGCALLLNFADAAAAARFIATLLDPQASPVTCAADAPAAGTAVRNIAFTFDGLRQCGLGEAELALFPDEFRLGMAARAGQIGDLRTNHPRRWARPRRLGAAASSVDDRIDLSAVHAVLNLRVVGQGSAAAFDGEVTNPLHPLHAEFQAVVAIGPGVQVLAAESMRRRFKTWPSGSTTIVEHFGFADGGSVPTIDPAAKDARINLVRLGELLLGHENEGDLAADLAADPDRWAWLYNGSFLVVRKLRQFVDRFDAAIGAGVSTHLDADTLRAKLMGRSQDGTPIVAEPTTARGPLNNNFAYNTKEGDHPGSVCPLHAHIRRANPRERSELINVPPGRRRPFIMRRSMSYGPAYDATDTKSVDAERGLMFMAYNASIGEQFEVVQRWLAGGNSTGGESGQSDPLLGVPENGRRRFFRFEHGGAAASVALDGNDELFEDPKPLVTLEWGAYLFAPSINALRRLRQTALGHHRPATAWNLDAGRRTLQGLLALDKRAKKAALLQWKRALEDAEPLRTFGAAAVWAAIRADHGGLLRTPYGVLVADAALAARVLADNDRLSVSGYRDRMQRSIGVDHLGLDDTGPGCPYRVESAPINGAILGLDEDRAFEVARQAVHDRLELLIDDARAIARDFDETRFDLSLDPRELIDEMLAVMCEEWFGLKEIDGIFERSALHWDWQPGQAALYPGHFGSSSRYIFQPHPLAEAERRGIEHGIAVRQSMLRFVRELRLKGLRPTRRDHVTRAEVGDAAFGPASAPIDDDTVARSLAGAVMGFVPTADGALRRVLLEWTGDGTLWALRAAQCGKPFADRAAAQSALLPALVAALQLRPMPEIVWRTVATPHELRGSDGRALQLAPGEKIVIALVSGLQQRLADASSDEAQLYLMFGGDRRAPAAPTHACPGYRAGKAAMLGLLAALVERPGGMRPGSTPPALSLEGPV